MPLNTVLVGREREVGDRITYYLNLDPSETETLSDSFARTIGIRGHCPREIGS